jgi:hypothetical protein
MAIMKLSHEEEVEVISEDGRLSAMRYEFCNQMKLTRSVIISGLIIVTIVLFIGILREWQVADIALLIGAISGAITAFAGALAGIATIGKIAQTSRENGLIGMYSGVVAQNSSGITLPNLTSVGPVKPGTIGG